MAVAHVALDFGPRHKRSDRVDHDHVDRVAPDKRLADLQRLLRRVRLRHQEVVDVHPDLGREDRIQAMFRVDKARNPPVLLGTGHHVQRDRCLARGFRAENLGHAPARQATHADGELERQTPRRNRPNQIDKRIIAQTHQRPAPKLLLQLAHSHIEGFYSEFSHIRTFGRHGRSPYDSTENMFTRIESCHNGPGLSRANFRPP